MSSIIYNKMTWEIFVVIIKNTQQQMTQISTTYSTLKQQLHSFDTNFESLSQKLSQITQTRTKINNQLQTLSKQYQKRIKQLQGKLDEALVKNQVLVKQNKLYKRDIEAFQSRLLEKEKLITMLIVQQGQKFDFVKSKSEIQRGGQKSENHRQKDKNTKKNYQSILPKNIHHPQSIPFPSKASQQHNKIAQQSTQQKTVKLPTNQNKKSQILTKAQQKSQIQPPKQPIQNSQENQNNTQNNKQTEVLSNNPVPLVPPPSTIKKKALPPPKPTKSRTKQKSNSVIQQQNIIDNVQTQRQQNIDTKTNTQPPQQKTQEINQQLKAPQAQKKSKNLSVPRPQKKTSPPVPSPSSKKIANLQFLQDSPKNIKQDDEENYNQKQEYQNLTNQQEHHQQKEQQQQNKRNQFNTVQPLKQEKQQIINHAQGYNSNIYQQENYQKIFDTGLNQHTTNIQNQNNERQAQPRRAPPPPSKSTKSSKIKPKNPPKKITQMNFQEQAADNPFKFDNPPYQSIKNQQNNQFDSHDQGAGYNPFGQVPQNNQKQHQEYQYHNTPSTQDFFSQFGAQPTNYSQDHGNVYSRNRKKSKGMIQAQQSSIDYADTGSIISSSAAHMFDSQFLPEQTPATTTKLQSSQIKKMTKKKNKRQVQELDPDSFA